MTLLLSEKRDTTFSQTTSPPVTWFGDVAGKMTIAFLALVVTHVLYVFFHWGGDDYKALISNIVTIFIYLATWLYAWRTSRNAALSRRSRFAWKFIGFANWSFLSGALLWTYFESYLGVQPFPSLADIGYLSYFPIMMTGLIFLVDPMRSAEERLGFALDIAIIMIGCGLVMWYFLLQPMIAAGDGFTLMTVLSVAYPIGDLVLLFGIVTILMRRSNATAGAPVTVLLIGVLLNFTADFIFGYQTLKGEYVSGDWVDALWTIACLPIVLGAHYQNLLASRAAPSAPNTPATTRMFGLPYLAVACAFGILTLAEWEQAQGIKEFAVPIAAAITGLLVLRQFMFLRETRFAKAAITDLQERIQGIYSASTDGIGIVDFNGKIVDANGSFARLTGYDREELMGGLSIEDLTATHDLDVTRDVHRRVIESQEAVEYEKRYRRKDGSTFFALVTVFPIRSLNGDVSAVAGIVRDITERKRSEDRLREAEERWQLALRVNRDGVWDWDLRHRQNYFSPRWREMFGYALDAQVEITLDGLFHPDDRHLAKELKDAMKSGRSPYVDIEFRHRCADDSYRWIRCRAEAVFDQSTGRLERVIGLNTDISEKKLRETESAAIGTILRAVSETANLKELLASVHRAIASVVYAKNFFVALHDKKTDLFEMQFFVDETDDAPPSISLEGTRSHYVFRTGQALLLDEDKTVELEAKGKFRLVGTQPKYWLGVPLRTPCEVIGVLVVQSYDEKHSYSDRQLEFLNNVAGPIALAIERKRAESRMLLLNAALDTAANAIVITDARGSIEWVNKAFTTLTGYSSEEVKGKSPRLLKSGKHPSEFYDELWKTILRGETWKGELVNRRKSGELYDEEMGIAPVTDPATGATHFIATKSDITERRLAEEQLRIFNQKLQQSNRELQDFAYVASHDLQEPLRKVQTFADRLRSKYSSQLDETGLDYLERMRDAGGRMQTLIQDLLSFSRITTKAQPFVRVDLREILAGVLSDLEVKIEETNAQVESDDLPTIDADPSQMRQLFQNLIGNALKFKLDDVAPIIRVTTEQIESPFGNTYQITVSDNGIGFDEKYLDKIFTVFQRLHGRSEYEGSGIGLAVCRKIVERHHGSITAHSAPGEGASFVIALPTHLAEMEGD